MFVVNSQNIVSMMNVLKSLHVECNHSHIVRTYKTNISKLKLPNIMMYSMIFQTARYKELYKFIVKVTLPNHQFLIFSYF